MIAKELQRELDKGFGIKYVEGEFGNYKPIVGKIFTLIEEFNLGIN